MDRKSIRRIFHLYGYKLLQESDNYYIFSDGHSMYPGVEIVCFDSYNKDELQSLKMEFSNQGYAVRICEPKDTEYIEDYLFNWFFRVEQSNNSIKERYRQYGDSVINSYGISDKEHEQYDYIDIPYKVEYDLEGTKMGDKGSLIPSIRKELDSKGPRLIIVEAAAGFGKTSTAMELLNSYADVKNNVRPFYMELYKDRQATVFRYLFLSQIHREFQVLMGDEIVNYNIEQGRIPLIIDGFDELLSEDLDRGNVKRAKRKGETMLSTIADLLRGNAKIVLTSRKTAILSGEEFMDWYQSKIGDNKEIHVSKYILDQPRLENWLDSQRLRLLGDKITGISNPVLLGYLRYLNQHDFISEAKSPNLIESYVKRLLEREMERQSLTITVKEQTHIFEKLAAAFAYEDITSDSRSNIKNNIELLCSDIIKHHVTNARDSQSIINTLTNHALLDRKINGTIGFVNDFVLGIFLGNAIIDETDETLKDFYKNISTNFLEKLTNAIAVSSENVRETVWMQLHDNCPNIPIEQRLLIDFRLMHRNMISYHHLSFDGLYIENVCMGETVETIEECHFINFQFVGGSINTNNVRNCTFINCTFNQVEMKGDNDTNDYFSCTRNGKEIKIETEEEVETYVAESLKTDFEIEEWIKMLSYYFQVDGHTRKMKMISMLKLEYNNNKTFKKVYSKLLSCGYIYVNGDKSHLTDSGATFYFTHKK